MKIAHFFIDRPIFAAVLSIAMGVAVFSGMIGVTVFGLLLTPVFFVTLKRKERVRVVSGPPLPVVASSAHA